MDNLCYLVHTDYGIISPNRHWRWGWGASFPGKEGMNNGAEEGKRGRWIDR